MIIIVLIQLAMQIVGLLIKGAIWACQHAFYLCVGLLLACTLPHSDYAPLGFGIGVGIAIATNLFLQGHALFYRQVVFGTVGFLTGLMLSIEAKSDSTELALTTLAFTGLCLWQAHQQS